MEKRPLVEKRVRITVTVNTGARVERVERIDASRLRVAVKDPPREGRANAAVVKAVAGFFGVPRSAVRIVHGAASRSKVLEVTLLGRRDLPDHDLLR